METEAGRPRSAFFSSACDIFAFEGEGRSSAASINFYTCCCPLGPRVGWGDHRRGCGGGRCVFVKRTQGRRGELSASTLSTPLSICRNLNETPLGSPSSPLRLHPKTILPRTGTKKSRKTTRSSAWSSRTVDPPPSPTSCAPEKTTVTAGPVMLLGRAEEEVGERRRKTDVFGRGCVWVRVSTFLTPFPPLSSCTLLHSLIILFVILLFGRCRTSLVTGRAKPFKLASSLLFLPTCPPAGPGVPFARGWPM